MQIPILDGIYTDNNSDFRTAYPVNLIPVPKGQGISAGYLRPAEGINHVADLPGVDRGGIVWRGEHYRVCGTKIVKISASSQVVEIGSVQSGGLCSFDYSFDYLAINAGNALYLYDGEDLQRVTDSNLGAVHDVIWVDGYFMTSDSDNIVVTELNNPFEVNPLKYGSSEVDPDPIVGLIKLRNEVYVLNRHTIEVFDNVGGEYFPFQRIDGAQTTKGTLSKNTACVYMDAIAMLGGGRNEAITVYISSAGSSQKIATREVEQILSNYTERQLTECQLEARQVDGHSWLYIHLPDQTLVYDSVASQTTGQPTWFILNSGNGYTARNMTYAYNKWFIGHTTESKLGVLTDETGEHWGDEVEWQFGTAIVYNESSGAIFHQLELVGLTGRNSFRKESSIYTQYSTDGMEWSMPKFISVGKQGQRNKRLVWFQQGCMQNWRIQRFKGTSDARLSIARLEAKIEPLGV
ncbi:packaged DNA stabilization protein [Acinetobacter sp. YH12052]|uniref:packaged DNA stabilization protein n=1 Tax=Acinetobacter sp. YH12052 TaxID=2601055 RepID=UPI0015D26FEF|nr:packaged DNA stabilization protein [Acinetobacter sp. YH12052]